MKTSEPGVQTVLAGSRFRNSVCFRVGLKAGKITVPYLKAVRQECFSSWEDGGERGVSHFVLLMCSVDWKGLLKVGRKTCFIHLLT